CGLLFRGQFDLNNLLDAALTQFYGDTNVKTIDSVFAFEIGSTRHDLLFILKYGFHHFDSGGRRSVVRGASLQIVHDLDAAVAGALNETLERRLIHQFRNWDTSDRGVAWKRNHGIPMAAEHKSGDVLNADL